MHIDEFDYHLPEDRIAKYPAEKRDGSRLMVLDRKTGEISHRLFSNLIDYLKPGDCLVMNNSKVLPARLFGIKKSTGAKVEFLLIRRVSGDNWETMVRPGKKLRPGDKVVFSEDEEFYAEIEDYSSDGTRIVRFYYNGDFMENLYEHGKMPLPPYIDRDAEATDNERYQTVYSLAPGSVAAPTAGLHFTNELLDEIKKKGISIAYVTLHVGIGTFRPVKCEQIEDHEMHFEEYEIPKESAVLISETKAKGGRIICVGTTSTRTLESAAELDGQDNISLKAKSDGTDIFIYPGYRFKIVDGLVTNFHLPKSTLLMLVSAFYDREKMLDAYKLAVEEGYRFFSYGDAMLIK